MTSDEKMALGQMGWQLRVSKRLNGTISFILKPTHRPLEDREVNVPDDVAHKALALLLANDDTMNKMGEMILHAQWEKLYQDEHNK